MQFSMNDGCGRHASSLGGGEGMLQPGEHAL